MYVIAHFDEKVSPFLFLLLLSDGAEGGPSSSAGVGGTAGGTAGLKKKGGGFSG